MSFRHISFEPYGESHAHKIGFTLRNLPVGITIDLSLVSKLLSLRLKSNNINTTRNGEEQFNVISGLTNNMTTSRPLVVELLNNGSKSSDYVQGQIRPSHADYVGYLNDGLNHEYRGGGIFSGRMTALYVIAGEIARQCICETQHEIKVYSHISNVANIYDDDIEKCVLDKLDTVLEQDIQMINSDKVNKLTEMLQTSEQKYSGEVTTIVVNSPSLLGGYFFDNLKSQISSLMLAIPGSRQILFGDYKQNKTDNFYVEDDEVKCDTNYDGGINGGISNGVTNIKFTVGYKAPSTNFNEVTTIKYSDGKFENTHLQMVGRHDKFIVNRAIYAQQGLTYLMLLDNLLFTGKYYD